MNPIAQAVQAWIDFNTDVLDADTLARIKGVTVLAVRDPSPENGEAAVGGLRQLKQRLRPGEWSHIDNLVAHLNRAIAEM